MCNLSVCCSCSRLLSWLWSLICAILPRLCHCFLGEKPSQGRFRVRVTRLLLPQLRRSQNTAVFCQGASLFPQTVPSNTGSGTSLNSTFLSRKESSSLWNLSSKSSFNSSSIRENSTMTLNSLRFGNLLIMTACSNRSTRGAICSSHLLVNGFSSEVGNESGMTNAGPCSMASEESFANCVRLMRSLNVIPE